MSSPFGCRDMSETANSAQKIQEIKFPPIPIFPGREQVRRVGPGASRTLQLNFLESLSFQDGAVFFGRYHNSRKMKFNFFGIVVLPG